MAIFFFFLGCGRSFYLGLSHASPLEKFMGSTQKRKKTTLEVKEFNDFLYFLEENLMT